MMKRICIMLFSICMLSSCSQNRNNHSNNAPKIFNSKDNNSTIDAGGSADAHAQGDCATQVPLDDYVPFLAAGAVVYGVWVNRKKKTIQA